MQPTPDQITTIRVDAAHPIKSFDPDIALGTSIDILPEDVVDKIYTPRSSRNLSQPVGDRSPIARTRNCKARPGIGIPTEPGATRPTRADISRAAQNWESPSGILPVIRCRIAATPRATDIREASTPE